MATITIDIPNTVAVRVQNAICTRFGYQDQVLNDDGTTSPNPETKAQFAKRMLAQYAKQIVIDVELEEAVSTLRTTEYEKLDSELNIT